MADRDTLDVYAEKAAEYARLFDGETPGRHLIAFVDALPDGARVLDLGCGTGRSAAYMQSAGIEVDAWDGSPEMAEIAKEKFGLDVQVFLFEDLDARDAYDGIFASFSLLHAPKREMPGHLRRIHTALRPDGLFYLGLKTGTGERRDRIGRFYAYYDEAELSGLLDSAGFAIKTRDTGEEAGLDGTVAPWIIITARALK